MKQLFENPRPPIQMFRPDSETPGGFKPLVTKIGSEVWACGECGILYAHQYGGSDNGQKQQAENCCKIQKCGCGNPIETNFYNKCDGCRKVDHVQLEVKRIMEAEEVNDHQGWIYCDGYGYQEGYFESVGDLIEWIEDQDDPESYPIPEFVFVCDPDELHISASDIIENALSDHYEDAGERIGSDEEAALQKFLDQWCADQNITSWNVNYKKKIRVNP